MKKVFQILFVFFACLIAFLSDVNASQADIACDADAKVCADWTVVWRTWANCEFVCPWDEIMCDDIYKPVCASLEVQCIKAPCNPVLQTFWNECEMKKNKNASFLFEWKCEDAVNAWMSNPASVNCLAKWWTIQDYKNDKWENYNLCVFANWKHCEEWAFFRWECDEKSDSAVVGMANPASLNCKEKWWRSVAKTIPSRGTYWVCVLQNNMQCEEWALYRWECPETWVKITWYDNEEAIYCAITWNTYRRLDTDPISWKNIAVCTDLDWYSQDAIDFYLNWKNTQEDNKRLSCNSLYNPVCGLDNRTYWNSCLADRVWVKYAWVCLWNKIEQLLEEAWLPIYKNYAENYTFLEWAIFFENFAKKAMKLSEESESRIRYSAYNYYAYLASMVLRDEYFTVYIEEKLANLIDTAPYEGSFWYLTNIKWETNNIAYVSYTDWQRIEVLKIAIYAKSDWIKIEKLEQRINITQKFDWTVFWVSLSVPNSWEWYYGYKYTKNYLDFFYKARKESNNSLLRIYFFTNKEWNELDYAERLINFRQLDTNMPDYVIAVKFGVNIVNYEPTTEYKIDENISNYSIMSKEVYSILESIWVYYK